MEGFTEKMVFQTRSISSSLCLLLLLMVFPGAAETSEVSVESNVSYKSVTELGFARADHKLVYGDANPGLQYGLLWLPENLSANEEAPLIVFIHGGCWLNAYDIKHSYPLASALAQSGYAVWSLEYRRTGDPGGAWPGSFDDIRQGLAYSAGLADYPLDLQRIVVMGHSAGGHLALLAASENQDIHAVIGLAAISDIVEYSRGTNSCQAAALEFMNGPYESKPAAYKTANPASRPVHRKTILLQGDADSIVPLDQSQLTGASATVYEGAGHFDWLHPGTGAYQLLLLTLEEVLQD